MRKKLEAKEAQFLRKMLRILRAARRYNKGDLHMTGTNIELLTVVIKRQLGFLGNVLRMDDLQSTCLLGMNEGKRAQERLGLTYTDGIREAADIRTIRDVPKFARDRKEYKPIIANVNFDTALE